MTEPILIKQKSLGAALHIEPLLAKANILQDIAYSTPRKNRAIGTPGHNATVNYLKDTIASFPDYYTVELQAFDISVAESANLTVNGVSIEVFGVTISPEGTVSGPLAVVANKGCEAVSVPACTNLSKSCMSNYLTGGFPN